MVDSLNVAPCHERNAIRNFMYKLKFLNERIRGWQSTHKKILKGELDMFKKDIEAVDVEIDKGNGSEELICKRLEILGKIQKINNVQASEIAQKAKIRWAIEGDENVKFFHGMLIRRGVNLISGVSW